MDWSVTATLRGCLSLASMHLVYKLFKAMWIIQVTCKLLLLSFVLFLLPDGITFHRYQIDDLHMPSTHKQLLIRRTSFAQRSGLRHIGNFSIVGSSSITVSTSTCCEEMLLRILFGVAKLLTMNGSRDSWKSGATIVIRL